MARGLGPRTFDVLAVKPTGIAECILRLVIDLLGRHGVVDRFDRGREDDGNVLPLRMSANRFRDSDAPVIIDPERGDLEPAVLD